MKGAVLVAIAATIGNFLQGWDNATIAAVVEALSAVVLIVLFLLQKFGTSRVSFLFSPIMGAWTLTTPLIGIYSIIHHYPSIFKAVSPHYIFRFFGRNGKEGWLLLSGTVLCITGSEALFADLGHFNRSSIQVCKIVEGQRYSRRLNERQITALLKVTCQRPHERERDIVLPKLTYNILT